ncbi:hypothetical protein [Tsukamurella paurometabola]|uniref:hypothetical protein n=1 Tax=Tsukamurella paurometabola TaxID=2061 RepID=UPI00019F0B51|nr:hypothetical protein [Tsukamurella paurometabola]
MTDLQALALAKSIRFAAGWLTAGMILLGLMIWQPWASPKVEDVPYGSSDSYSRCVVYKNSVDCPR